MDRLKEKVEESYSNKRYDCLMPKDGLKILFVIDDIHLQANIKTNYLEFFRAWCVQGGYFDIGKGHFKQVSHFAILTAQNVNY